MAADGYNAGCFRTGRPSPFPEVPAMSWKSVCAALAVSLSAAIPAAAENPDTKAEPGFVSIFNGKDLTGWKGNAKIWKVENGLLVGKSPGINYNDFLDTKKSYGDFELRLEFRMQDGKGNSGVQFRSRRIPKSTHVQGYQADLGAGYWGCLYDEHRRNKVLVKAPKSLAKVLKTGGWNTYVIRAEGSHITLTINGLKTVDYKEPDAKIARKGIISLQIHAGPAMRMEFRNMRIRELGKK
jgi:3-keto-disaccharide hydrolase